jgi:23S rRNA (adenine2503-C2)-methyltransferase
MQLDQHSPPASDGSVKYRFRTSDHYFIEALRFTYHNNLKILCLSTQIGCNMGCKFCGTGLHKKIRNLTQDEIVKQASIIVDHHLGGLCPDTITLAGSGEPLSNYEASLGALDIFRTIYGNIRLSLSTIGIINNIRRMCKEKRSYSIYLSLHAADDATRKRIMPAAEKNPIIPLLAAAEEYLKINQPRLVKISYLLLPGINDSQEHLSKLITILHGKGFVVQLRLWNKVQEIEMQRAPMSVAGFWEQALNEAGIEACIRPSAGQEIAGGCGQMIIQKNTTSRFRDLSLKTTLAVSLLSLPLSLESKLSSEDDLSKNAIKELSNMKKNNVQRQIEKIESIQEAVPFLENLDEKAIVLFDIDGVITIPAEPCLHPAIFKKYGSLIDRLTSHFNREQRHIFNHLIVARTSKLIEKTFVDVLASLQKKNIKTFAFTASSPGIIHPKLPPFHLVREKYLQDLNINFSIQNSKNADFTELNPTKGEYPGIRNGIIYSCGLNNSKGAVLKRFLSGYPSMSKIIFFDDKLKNLDSVMETIQADFSSIEFYGFHYQGADYLQSQDPGEDQVRKYVESLVELTIGND